MTIPVQITIAKKHIGKRRRKGVAERVSEYQGAFEAKSVFSSNNPQSHQISTRMSCSTVFPFRLIIQSHPKQRLP